MLQQRKFTPDNVTTQALPLECLYLYGGINESKAEANLFGDPVGTRTDKQRVLVVDDAPDIAELLAMLFRHTGYEVEIAFSAAEALEAAQQEQFDVVVSDIGMPQMNGYELAQALRALPNYQSIPMIAVTGFAMYADQEQALQAGFNAHLAKPVDPRALLDLVKRLHG